MARAFHNLEGLVRDVLAASSGRANGDDKAAALWSRWVDCIEWALEEIEGPRDADDAEDGDADASDQLALDIQPQRAGSLAQPGGHDARGNDHGAPASALDAILDGVAGPLRARALEELDALRRDALAGTQPGAKRLTCMPEADDGTE